MAAATEQAELRGRAAGKLDEPTAWLLTRPGLEQASGSRPAAHRARRFAGLDGTAVDLCCGIGGDLRELRRVTGVVGVDRDETHAICAAHNSGAHVAVADARDVRLTGVSAALVDPARRSGARRGGSEPPLSWCLGLPIDRICVKAAPGIERHAVPAGWESEFVADGRALKEAVLWSPPWSTAGSRATILPGGHTMSHDPHIARPPLLPPGRYLLDPSPAVTRAEAVADLAAVLGAWQLDPRIAFLSADVPLVSEFGRSLTVEVSMPFGVKPLAAELRRLDIGTIDIRRRGLAGDVTDLGRRLKPRGSRSATVVLTRVMDRPWAMVCVA